MSTAHVSTKDSADILFNDWGTVQPVVFSHGWPLNADASDDAMMAVAANGLRGVAQDRRGGGRPSHPWDGNDMDTCAHRDATRQMAGRTGGVRRLCDDSPAANRLEPAAQQIVA